MNQRSTGTAGEFLPTRHSLLTRLKNWDDQTGWREFFDTYWKLIYSVGRKAGLNEADAEDLVQETIVAVAKKMKRFHYDPALGSFKAWLLLNVKSRIADHLRRRNCRIRTVAPAAGETPRTALVESFPDPAPNHLDAIWEAEWETRLREAAVERVKRKVSVKQFQIFDLYALQQVPLGRITRSLGISAAQAYVAKHRVARLVRQELQRLEAEML